MLEPFQSNHEGALIDRLEQLDFDAVICNFGALSHTSYALHDALLAADRPAVEVHISDIAAREPWRRTSVTAPATQHQVIGHGWRGYLEAVDWLLDAAEELGSRQGAPAAVFASASRYASRRAVSSSVQASGGAMRAKAST